MQPASNWFNEQFALFTRTIYLERFELTELEKLVLTYVAVFPTATVVVVDMSFEKKHTIRTWNALRKVMCINLSIWKLSTCLQTPMTLRLKTRSWWSMWRNDGKRVVSNEVEKPIWRPPTEANAHTVLVQKACAILAHWCWRVLTGLQEIRMRSNALVYKGSVRTRSQLEARRDPKIACSPFKRGVLADSFSYASRTSPKSKKVHSCSGGKQNFRSYHTTSHSICMSRQHTQTQNNRLKWTIILSLLLHVYKNSKSLYI